MAFPTSSVAVDFTGANTNPINGTTGFLSGTCGVDANFGGNCQRLTNRGAASSGAGSVIHDLTKSRASMSIEMQLTVQNSGFTGFDFFIAGLLTDPSSAARDGYAIIQQDGDLNLYRITNDALTSLGTHAADLAAGDEIGAQFDPDGTITVYLNAASVISVSDSTYTSGYVAWGSENSSYAVDDLFYAEVTPPPPPTWPIVATQATISGTSHGNDRAATMPSGVTVGDLLIAIDTVDSTTAPTRDAGAASQEWTVLADQDSGLHDTLIVGKIADGSDSLLFDGPTQDYVIQVFRITGHGLTNISQLVDGASPDLVTKATANTSANADPPSSNAHGITDPILVLAIASMDCTTASVITAHPSTYTGIGTHAKSASSTSSVALSSAWLGLDPGATQNPGAFTSSNRAWSAFTIVVPGSSSGVSGTASATLTLTATVTGTRNRPGTAAKALTLTATANGTRTVLGSAAKTLTLTATAAGAPVRLGTAAKALTLTASASGVVTHPGVAAKTLTLTATASGTRTVLGSASRALTLSATASGTRTTAGTAAKSLTLTATASGVKTVSGAASKTLTLSATASGTVDTAGSVAGTASKALTLTATASGTRTTAGTATKALTLSATATALRTVLGTASRSLTLTATALGTIESGGAFTQPYLRLSGTATRKPFKHKPGGTVTEAQLYLKTGGTVGPLA